MSRHGPSQGSRAASLRLQDALSARGRSAVREAFGREDAGGLEGRKLGAWRTMLEDIVVAHNIAGPDGEPLALGAGGAEWLPVALIHATHSAYTGSNRINRRKSYL